MATHRIRIDITERTAELLAPLDRDRPAAEVDGIVDSLLAASLPELSRSHLAKKAEEGLAEKREYSKERHDDRRAAGICINALGHGPAVKGGRCQGCWDKKKAAEAGRVRKDRPKP